MWSTSSKKGGFTLHLPTPQALEANAAPAAAAGRQQLLGVVGGRLAMLNVNDRKGPKGSLVFAVPLKV